MPAGISRPCEHWRKWLSSESFKERMRQWQRNGADKIVGGECDAEDGEVPSAEATLRPESGGDNGAEYDDHTGEQKERQAQRAANRNDQDICGTKYDRNAPRSPLGSHERPRTGG